MRSIDLIVLTVYYFALTLLAVCGLHRLYLVRLRRSCFEAPPSPAPPVNWPSVTVQLPLFNEPNVVARLIDAAAAIDYPGAFDIQVLDDSTDETTKIAAARVAAHRERGIGIQHVRRSVRDGFKAGALAHGLTKSESELLLVLDADFVPPPDILTRMVPYFGDPEVGMVQARWGHINREQSLLTRVQAIYLDGHFAIESAARCFSGRFFNFNGTAGIWRRRAIESAGGWSSSTLTEDLDLSYRAQLAGWRFVFLPQVEVAAELPSALSGFQEQQHRWAKGSIQTARKILPSILSSPDLPNSIKAEAWFHLTNNSAYLLTSVVALLVVPAMLVRQRLGISWTYALDALLILSSTGSVLRFYVEGQKYAHRDSLPLRELLAVLPVGIAISLRNTAAVIEGLFSDGGIFLRTPKRGDAATARADRRPRMPVGEMILALFFAVAVAMLISARLWLAVPLLSLFLIGYAFAAVCGVRERLRHS